MFVGHFALGFAAKRATPKMSLAALFAAAQLVGGALLMLWSWWTDRHREVV